MKRLHPLLLLTIAASSVLVAATLRAESAVVPAARIAIVGDSITEQKLYSKFLECYLLACSGVSNVRVMQFGWGGETAGGFANRVENDLAAFHPTVVTLCYGMNDGGYQPWKTEIGAGYEKNMRGVLSKLDRMGVKEIVIGSPVQLTPTSFGRGRRWGSSSRMWPTTTISPIWRDIDKQLAVENRQRFADVHGAMVAGMQKANESWGPRMTCAAAMDFTPAPTASS